MSATGKIAADLVDWAVSQGAKLHPNVEVYLDPLTGLSFRVKASAVGGVPAYEPIVQLPTSLTLSYVNAVKERAFDNNFLARTPPHVVGRLFLVQEFLKGEASFWYPYIRTLPQPQDHKAWALPQFWPEHEAELLQGTNLEVGLEKLRGDAKADLDRYVGDLATEQLYHWAYCIFSSRSFRPSLVLLDHQQDLIEFREGAKVDVGEDDFSVLLPLFDIGNHDMTVDVRWELDPEKKLCGLRIDRNHRPGQQVFNNYSMKTNAELLLGYGFMIDPSDELHNDYTHLRKRAAPMTASGESQTATSTSSKEWLISLRPVTHPSSMLVRARQTLYLHPETDILASFRHFQPEMIWDIVCALTSADERMDMFPVNVRSAVRGLSNHQRQMRDFLSGQVHGDDARHLLQTIVATLQYKVRQELDSLDKSHVDLADGSPADLTRNQILALDYRGRCRNVLEAVLKAIKSDDILDDLVDDDDSDGDVQQ